MIKLRHVIKQFFAVKMMQWINYRAISESVVLICAALFVGIISASGVLIFKRMIALVHWTAINRMCIALSFFGHWTYLLVPVMPLIGGLIVGVVVHYFIREDRYHGAAGITEAVALAGGDCIINLYRPKQLPRRYPLVRERRLVQRTPRCKLAQTLARCVGNCYAFLMNECEYLLHQGQPVELLPPSMRQ